MNRKRGIFLLIFLVSLLFIINYKFINNAIVEFLTDYETAVVKRIIDGDTVVVENNTHVRLLGINTPEKGEKYYNEAKNFLEMIILNKTVKLEYGNEKYDKYGRTLAYIILNNKNINSEIVEGGFGNTYIYSDDEYTTRLKQAWNECISNEKNLCEKSDDKCAKCIELEKLDVKNQEIIFNNNCSFDCDLTSWTIKDEGRKRFIFQNFILEKNKEVKIIVGNETNTNNILYWKNEGYVWTSTGDTLFLRDADGKLVLWRAY